MPQPYRIAPSAFRSTQYAGQLGSLGAAGVIVGGRRLATGDRGLLVAASMAEQPLRSGLLLPSRLGGGLLFWGGEDLYRADSMLGPLVPLATLGDGIESVSLGGDVVLVHGVSGVRVALSPTTGARAPLSPVGLLDVAALGDGRALAVTEGGRLLGTAAGDGSWRDLTGRLGQRVARLESGRDAVWAVTETAQALRLEPDGTLLPLPSPPAAAPAGRVTDDPRWHGDLAPIEQAVADGVAEGKDTALVVDAGAIARVSLGTGAVSWVTRVFAPPGYGCALVRAADDVLGVCRSQGRPAVVYAGIAEGKPAVEQRFATDAQFAAAQDTIVFGAGCEATSVTAGQACVRSARGKWTGIDVTAALGASLQGVAPRALRWVPRAGNGAVALVEAKETFLLDGRSAAVTRLGADAAREVAAAARRDSTVVVARNALVAADGTLRLWQGQRLVSLSAHGEPEQSARQYEWRLLAAGGSRAVAFDPYGRCFQSTDWGRSWLEVTAPPARIEERSDSTVGCSEVGCRLGPLLRLGWPTDLLAAEPAPELSTRPPRLPTDARPTLSCVSAGAPAFSRQPAPTEEDQERHVALGLGARRIVVGQGDDPGWIVRHGRALSHPYRGDDGDEALRAITYGLLGAWAVDDRTGATAPDAAAARALRRSAFIEPFDPSATIHEASLRLGELLETAARGRGARPSEGQPPETGGAIPVLGTTPGKLDGVLLTGPPGPVIWMMSSPRPRMLPLSLGPDVDYDAVIVSAVRTGAEELTVLVANSQGGATDVVALAPSGARRLWRLEARADCCGYPVNPDALGRAPDGSVVVIRTASGEEPASTLDPALALPAAGPEQALAAWSSLRVASDPACQQDPDGLRLVLQTTTRWIDLRSGGARVEAEGPMWATVRWGSARCCLEAVELAMDRVYLDEVERTTALVARFVPPLAEAARAGIHLGLEYRQAMRCELQSPP